MTPATRAALRAVEALIEAAEATDKLTEKTQWDYYIMQIRHTIIQLEGAETP